jgi:DNA-binding NtrC family response regulator
MTGKSTAILWELIGRLSDTCLTIHISGESGTGKEAIARLIHHHCPHPDAQFLKCDFQHLGADQERRYSALAKLRDWLASPRHNVLYFRHIEEMPVDIQEHLQRTLERKCLTLPPWILTSSDQPLETHRVNNPLKEKLIERLNTIHIHIPPLRETPEQIPQILAWYLNHENDDVAHGLPLMPDPSTMKHLMEYRWPGNLHQLRHISLRIIEQQRWDTVINTMETRSTKSTQNTQIIDEMMAIFILSISKIRISKEKVLESLIAASDTNDVGLLDVAILHEVASQFADRISMPTRKDHRHEV